ncbi:MAG: DMT family transporter [Pseudomonadota bacterium]
MTGSNIRGIALMTAGMAAFAVGDLFVKLTALRIPLPQVVLVQALGGLAIFLVLSWAKSVRLRSPLIWTRPVQIRCWAEIVAALGITTGLAYSELSTAAALMQVLPIFAMVGAVVFLGERVGWRRWASVAVGLLGVLVIIRPDGGIEPGLLAILIGVVGLTARDLATRAVDPGASSLALSVYSFAALAPVAAIWLLMWGGWQPVDLVTGLMLATMTLSVAFAFFMVTASLRDGEVSAIIPFRYTRLLFALLLAFAILGERPDGAVFLGGALIIGSGLYALLRERRASRPAPA